MTDREFWINGPPVELDPEKRLAPYRRPKRQDDGGIPKGAFFLAGLVASDLYNEHKRQRRLQQQEESYIEESYIDPVLPPQQRPPQPSQPFLWREVSRADLWLNIAFLIPLFALLIWIG